MTSTTPTPLHGSHHIPLVAADLITLAGAVTWTGEALCSVHGDADGHETGRELTWPSRRHSFTRGDRRSLVASPPGPGRTRLAIACGPLPLVCIAAIEGRTDAVYVTLGGSGPPPPPRPPR